MKNQKSVFIGSDEFICQQFDGGIDILDENNVHIGEIEGLELPDIDDEDENIKFDQEIECFLNENYY